MTLLNRMDGHKFQIIYEQKNNKTEKCLKFKMRFDGSGLNADGKCVSVRKGHDNYYYLAKLDADLSNNEECLFDFVGTENRFAIRSRKSMKWMNIKGFWKLGNFPVEYNERTYFSLQRMN